MDKGIDLDFVKFDTTKDAHLKFLSVNVRPFYTKEIANWQYPSNNIAGLFFVEKDNEPIAAQGMIPINLNFQGRTILSAKSESSFLLPNFRKQGIFEALYFYTMDVSHKSNINYFWGFTALSSLWRNKLKFEVYEKIINESELQISFRKSIISILNSKASFKNKIKQSLKSVFSLLKTKRMYSKNGLFAKYLDLNNEDSLKRIVKLYEKWQIAYPDNVSLMCDEAYLKWRIANNPIAKYKVIGVFKNEELVGFGIVNDLEGKSYLLDFIVPDSELMLQCFDALLIQLKYHSSISHIVYWASLKNLYSKSVHTLFYRYGAYSYENCSMNFIYKSTCKDSNEIDISKFYLNGLWTEGFKI